MEKQPSTSQEFVDKLSQFRQEIDTLDDKLIALLIERIGIINRVGELKRKHYPGQCPLRAGREAEMVKRIIEKFNGSPFSPAAAATMWRTLIGASTAAEGMLKLSVYAPDGDDSFYWLGREYFGPFLSSTKQSQIKRVIGDIMDQKASIGIVPLLKRDDDSHWWTSLVQPGKDMPKIFAHIPFIRFKQDTAAGFAIGNISPEPSGDDKSIWVLEVDHDVSQTRLQTMLVNAKLDTSWISIAALSNDRRHHLVEITGFITPDDGKVHHTLNGLAKSLINTHFLGAYAVPITLPYLSNEQGTSHASRTAKA